MKIGVFAVLFSDQPLPEVAGYLRDVGCGAIELGCGGYPGKAHCNSAELLASEEKFAEFSQVLSDSGLELSALSMHGNPIHPDPEFAKEHLSDQRNAILLAEKLGLDTVITFSGCPGDAPGAKYPNWVTCAWPPDYPEILRYQWEEVLIPFWREEAAFAADHGVTKIALEMHPGFSVYNIDSLLQLREAVGVHAVVHMGKHGNLEWLPGKALALSRDCFPEAAAGSLASQRIIEDPDEVVRRAPDLIIGSWCGRKFRPERVAARPGWEEVPAVRDGEIHEIKSPLILQPGPAALTDGVRAIHDLVHAWAHR